MAEVRSTVAAVVAAVTTAGILTVIPANDAAAAPHSAARASAAKSVITVPRKRIHPDALSGPRTLGVDGRTLSPAGPVHVTWPKAGEATVAVPDGAAAATVGTTAVAIASPSRQSARAGVGTPDRVKVTAYGADTARTLGGYGTAFRVARADGRSGPATVGVRVDVSGFAGAFGGDFESRLRLLSLPACAMTDPGRMACRDGTPVSGRVDLRTHTLEADVPTGQAADERVFVVAAAANGEAGSATATKLKSSSKWSVGLQSGDFTWSLPLPEVPAVAGDAPDVNLGYSSQSVDGLVAAENNQPSWVGLGWDLALPYIERRYRSCVDDGGDTADECWDGDHLVLSLQGTSSPLVKDSAADGDVWRARDDPGWRVERHRGADNGDNDGEYWTVQTPQGTTFTFGRGHQSTTDTATDSVDTVPVFGDDDGEPCHKSSLDDSWCQQAWRWNLDGVVDAHGNSSTYFYTRETNRYARNGDPDKSTDYVRGGYLHDIAYSQRSGKEDVQAPARLHFTVDRRCTEAADGSGTCPAFDQDHASSYPDVPLDSLCTGRCTADEQKAPTFFTGYLLRSVTAQRSAANGGWADVDRLDFTYSFPKPSDGTSASLWLEKVQQTGLAGGGHESLPAVEFTGKELANRVDADPAAGAPEMRKLRLTSAVDELGRRVDVGYGQPDPCPLDDMPVGHFDSNTQDCYPGWRTNGTDSGFGVWNKYLTTKVTVHDTGGGSPPQVTEYRYRGKPAWHHDIDDVTPDKRQSWGDWRGYGSVDVAQMSDPDYRGEQTSHAVSVTRSLFFRGMDGDPNADGSHKSVTVTDSQGTSLTDLPYLRGKQRESRQFDVNASGDMTYELGGTIHDYTSAHTTPAKPGETSAQNDAHLVVEKDSVTRQTVIADDGGRSTRTTSLHTDYDTYGQPTSVLDEAGSDKRCTKTSYPRDSKTVDAWMLAFPYRIRTYAGSCDEPTALVTGKDQYYDGSTDLGGPVSHGDVTRSVSAVSASGPDTVSDTVTTTATFDAYGRTLSKTDGDGNVSRTAYDPATGRPTTVTETNALGQAEVTTLEPDRQQPASVKDANGQVTTNSYDALGRLVSTRQPEQSADDPPAQVFSYFLDPAHEKAPRVTTKQLQSGDHYVTTWAFLDSLGRDRQTQEVSPASTPDEPKTVVTDTRYDDAGHVAANSLPVVVAGDAGSALLAVPGGQVDETRHSYDALGRETESAQYGNGDQLWATKTAYYGDHTRVTPPRGGAVTTSWTDARDRQVKSQQGTGENLVTTSYTYTAADKIATSTDPEGHRTSYGYDLLGRRVSATDPDAGRTRTEYDADGNPVALWDAKALDAGKTTPTLSTEYDALGRPVARWAGAAHQGTKVAAWTYDSSSISNGIGQLASQATYTAHGVYTQSVTGYDPRGRPTGKSWTFPVGAGGLLEPRTFHVSYGYDAADHQVSVRYSDPVIGTPAETVRTGYDALGNPATVTGNITDPLTGKEKTEAYVSATHYAADGKLAGRDYANPHHPLSRAYAYEPETQRLSRIQTLVGDSLTGRTKAVQDDRYAWDPAGNLTSITDSTLPEPVATCFGYDQLDRLTHAWTTEHTDCTDSESTLTHDGPAGFNESWTYTQDGNISSARSLGHTRDFAYGDPDHPHAVTKAGDERYSYDANGAMTKQAEGLGLLPVTFDWNAEHQLTSSTNTLLAKTRFVYLPDGTRVARIDPAGTATLYLDGEEITVALGLIKGGTRFYQEAGVTVAERLPTGLLKWQLADTQGSAQIAVLAGTSIGERTYYDPFGDIRIGSAPPVTDHGFLGKVKDPTTGLDLLGARYYNADLGRFISTDPAMDSSSAQTANPYSYGANNPVMYVDPTGLWSLSGAWNSVKKAASTAWDWTTEHKGLIADVAVGIGVGIAIGAVCSTGVGCVILAGAAAGAAGAAAGYGVDVAEGKTQFSWGGLAMTTAVGGLFGAAGAGLGAAAGALVRNGARAAIEGTAGKLASDGEKAVTGAVSKSGRAATNSAEAEGGKVADAGRNVSRGVSKTATPAAKPAVSPAAESGDTLLSAGGRSARLPMNMGTVRSVASKYAIQIDDLSIRIDKAVAGRRGSTAPNGCVTLCRGAFENEEQLAKTLVHERVHVEDLRAGMPYPSTYNAQSEAETRAEAIANAWWESFQQ